uniref:Uncharacterized protein n=1 Tax=mine drainage metagenome TaxID=410659 RepID=E6PD40_9ZZZZ
MVRNGGILPYLSESRSSGHTHLRHNIQKIADSIYSMVVVKRLPAMQSFFCKEVASNSTLSDAMNLIPIDHSILVNDGDVRNGENIPNGRWLPGVQGVDETGEGREVGGGWRSRCGYRSG